MIEADHRSRNRGRLIRGRLLRQRRAPAARPARAGPSVRAVGRTGWSPSDTLTIVGDLCDFWFVARQLDAATTACEGLRRWRRSGRGAARSRSCPATTTSGSARSTSGPWARTSWSSPCGSSGTACASSWSTATVWGRARPGRPDGEPRLPRRLPSRSRASGQGPRPPAGAGQRPGTRGRRPPPPRCLPALSPTARPGPPTSSSSATSTGPSTTDDAPPDGRPRRLAAAIELPQRRRPRTRSLIVEADPASMPCESPRMTLAMAKFDHHLHTARHSPDSIDRPARPDRTRPRQRARRRGDHRARLSSGRPTSSPSWPRRRAGLQDLLGSGGLGPRGALPRLRPARPRRGPGGRHADGAAPGRAGGTRRPSSPRTRSAGTSRSTPSSPSTARPSTRSSWSATTSPPRPAGRPRGPRTPPDGRDRLERRPRGRHHRLLLHRVLGRDRDPRRLRRRPPPASRPAETPPRRTPGRRARRRVTVRDRGPWSWRI